MPAFSCVGRNFSFEKVLTTLSYKNVNSESAEKLTLSTAADGSVLRLSERNSPIEIANSLLMLFSFLVSISYQCSLSMSEAIKLTKEELNIFHIRFVLEEVRNFSEVYCGLFEFFDP